MKKVARKLIVFVIVICVVVGLKAYNKSKTSDTIKTDTYELVQKLPSYEKEQAYIDKIFESSYKAAFDSSYSGGGRHKDASFDTSKYIGTVFDNMVAAAKKDSKDKLAGELAIYKVLLLAGIEEESGD